VILWPIVILVDFFIKFKNHFKKSHYVHILNYHSISSDIKKRGFGYHSVSRNVFSKQMKYLAENDYNVIDLDDFIQLKEKRRLIPPKTVILTFDDGFADNYTLAFPVISKYSLKAVLSVITEYIDRNRPFPWPFNRVFHRFNISRGLKMERLSRTKIGFLGRGYIAKYQKLVPF